MPHRKISAFVDTKSRKAKSFIKDTTDSLLEIKDFEVEPGDILVVIDVRSLYTSILHNLGVKAMKNELNEEGMVPSHIWILTALAKVILENNEFGFNGKYYTLKRKSCFRIFKYAQLIKI